MNVLTIIIAVAVIYSIYKLIQDYRKARKDIQELRRDINDLNIEFSAQEGTGIELVKKQYPEMNMKDDRRTGIVDEKKDKGHSISNGMNDSTRAAKHDFPEGK